MRLIDHLSIQVRKLENIAHPTFKDLGQRVFAEFGDLHDYLWKSPKFIEAERELELEKRQAYFPLNGDPEHDVQALRLRSLRQHLENEKLQSVFPAKVAASNLFILLSVYEFYCLLLAKEVEKMSSKKLADVRGSGLSRIHNYLSQCEIEVPSGLFHEQVRAAGLIRNILFHANGLLSFSRDKDEICRVVKSQSYVTADVRENYREMPPRQPLVQIRPGELGEELSISTVYPHVAAGFARGHLIDLCWSAGKVFPSAGNLK